MVLGGVEARSKYNQNILFKNSQIRKFSLISLEYFHIRNFRLCSKRWNVIVYCLFLCICVWYMQCTYSDTYVCAYVRQEEDLTVLINHSLPFPLEMEPLIELELGWHLACKTQWSSCFLSLHWHSAGVIGMPNHTYFF